MIRLLTTPAILPENAAGWAAACVTSRALAYGTHERFAPFYGDDAGNILSLLDGNAILSHNAANPEEWAAFLAIQPDIVSFSAAYITASAIAALLQRPCVPQAVLSQQFAAAPLKDGSFKNPSPRLLYPVLHRVFGDALPPFDSWYVDVSHRMRHGLCHAVTVQENGEIVSVAMTVAETPTAAVIGAVATLPVCRNRGYATQCLQSLTTLLSEKNDRKVYILPADTAAHRLYTANGFTVSEEIGTIQIKG